MAKEKSKQTARKQYNKWSDKRMKEALNWYSGILQPGP